MSPGSEKSKGAKKRGEGRLGVVVVLDETSLSLSLSLFDFDVRPRN